ncbi:MAG: MFS transporter [Candidatus Bathyarchaeota archaeon]|nr:MFS transporter [Candidatus Bathyarchaeota archaeon]
MWRLGFFFHETAFGLLSVFVPLYVVTLGGTLVDIGIMASIALFAAIPSSLFWGYVCDRTRRYRRYILLSFISVAVLLYLFTLTASVHMFIALYAVMSVLHVAHEAPKNVLIAEHYSREEWEKSYAFYEGFTEIGWLLGLLLGFLVSALGFNSNFVLFLCSGLNLLAFVFSVFLVADPLLIFERRLVSIEKKIDHASQNAWVASKVLAGLPLREKLKGENFRVFGAGLLLFALASSMFFTPLPIFFSQQLALPASMVFMIYMLNSSGAVAGYFVSARTKRAEEKTRVRQIVLFRSVLILLLTVLVQLAVYPTITAAAILILMGFAYALYYVFTLSLSMELIPAGKTGVFDVLVNIGGACGSFIGPLLAQTLGFLFQFVAASVLFFAAYIIFRIFS